MNKYILSKLIFFMIIGTQSACAMESSWKKRLAVGSAVGTLATGLALVLIKTEVENENFTLNIESAPYIPSIIEAENIFTYYNDLDSADAETAKIARERLTDVKKTHQYPLIYAHALITKTIAQLTTLKRHLHWQRFGWISSSTQTESAFTRAQRLLEAIIKSKAYALEVHSQQVPVAINVRQLDMHAPDKPCSETEMRHAIMGSLAVLIESPSEQLFPNK